MSESAARMEKAIDRAADEFVVRLSALEIQRGEAAKVALDAMAARDAAFAVIEQMRELHPLASVPTGGGDFEIVCLGCGYISADEESDQCPTTRALAASPPDALDAVKAAAWDEGHKYRWKRGPDECRCSAWSSNECACGLYGTGPLLSIDDNPYRNPRTPGEETT